MAGDDSLRFDVAPEILAHALRYISVAGSVKTVTANVVFRIQVIGNGIEIGIVGHRAMECVVEHADLRRLRHQCIHGPESAQMTGVVNRSKVAKFLYSCLYLLIDDDAVAEFVASLHDSMAYGIYLVKALDSADFRIEKTLEHEVYALFVIGHIVHDLLFLTVGQRDFDESFV